MLQEIRSKYFTLEMVIVYLFIYLFLNNFFAVAEILVNMIMFINKLKQKY